MATAMAFLKEKRLTVQQIADMIPVNPATVLVWINDGVNGRKLPARKIGARYTILESDFEKFLSPESNDGDEVTSDGTTAN